MCTGQDEGKMTIFTAKGRRGKEAEAKKQRELSFLCLFAPLLLCSKKFHQQFDHYIMTKIGTQIRQRTQITSV
jgi:hypothetical protein